MGTLSSNITNSRIGPDSRIYVAGHRGLVGSALMRGLRARGYTNVVARTRAELDLKDQNAVRRFMSASRPDYVFMAAARVGGILANDTHRGDFIYENLIMAANVIEAALRAGVGRLMFLGSSCIYPRESPQPIREQHLLTGPFEPTNEPYAVAKVAAVKLCEAFNAQHGTRYASVMPTNLYGPHDNFDLATSHALPALLRKAHDAKRTGARSLTVWGTGRPRRDFLYVDDLADACILLMEKGADGGIYNIGSGSDLTVREIAETAMRTVGFDGDIVLDTAKPDGMMRKLLDTTRIRRVGWSPRHDLAQGLALTYQWCLRNDVFEQAALESS